MAEKRAHSDSTTELSFYTLDIWFSAWWWIQWCTHNLL